ncbi:hypothetical protein A2U01_0074332 [Trifolium medium]|uniref:Uncharacterized protein n=1 Tax=Trifolium medium TaxID=97028 RepID=A0A392SYX5_9FABA|nr:hypothetical protein [Trifolium medium]
MVETKSQRGGQRRSTGGRHGGSRQRTGGGRQYMAELRPPARRRAVGLRR